jgi:methylase of polypeptide subunit release factors
MGISFVDQVPVRMGRPDEFARIAKVLREARFDERTVCQTLKLKSISDLGSVKEDEIDFRNTSPQLQVLIKLFQCVNLVPRPEVERAFDVPTIDAFLSLGLLGIGEFGHDEYYARVLFYPVAGFWIASDRHTAPDHSQFEPPPDTVFPAIYRGSMRYLKLLPVSRADDALDLCSGAGIGALVLSRISKVAVASDITPRATAFAEFNRTLNNCENVEVVCGDLFEPVRGRTFDRIGSHPPYVPSIGVVTVWRDGGATGESLVTKIIEGLPEYLRPGGIFCCVTQGLDTEEGNFELRARSWLKDSSDEFDVVFASEHERTPQRVLELLAGRGTLGDTGLHELQSEFDRAKILKVPYGALFIRRAMKGTRRPTWTARKRLSDETDGVDVEAVFLQHDRNSDSSFISQLPEATPLLAPRLELKVTYVVHEGELEPAKYVFETDKPFSLKVEFDNWMVPLITRFNGTLTVAEIYQEARSKGATPETFRLQDFVGFVARSIDGGLLLLPGQASSK